MIERKNQCLSEPTPPLPKRVFYSELHAFGVSAHDRELVDGSRGQNAQTRNLDLQNHARHPNKMVHG